MRCRVRCAPAPSFAGLTTDKYDFFVAFDEYGRNSYVTALTAAQVVFGPTPYSLRLLNTLLFTVGALLLFRLCRDAFGALPAFGGLAVAAFVAQPVRLVDLAAEGIAVFRSSARSCSPARSPSCAAVVAIARARACRPSPPPPRSAATCGPARWR